MAHQNGGKDNLRDSSQVDEQDVDAGQTSSQDEGEGKAKPVNPRDAIFASLDAKREEQLQQDAVYALNSGHHLAVQVEAERRGAAESKDEADKGIADTDAAAEAPAQDEPGTDDGDPLAGFVVMQDGKPMIKLKVDGKERMIPFDAARAQLQKSEAAEVRLQRAAEERRQLDTRAEQLRLSEVALKAREAKLSQPSTTAADDQALKTEAEALAASLLTEPQEVIADKLVKFVAKTRQAATPSVDANDIINRAAAKARSEIKAEETERNVNTGWKQFQTDYSDIASDEKLFKLADGMTDDIATEHPEWAPADVMLEAGKRTREWVQTMKGTAAPSRPGIDRQERKQNLRPLPPTRSARPTQGKQQQVADTPQSVVQEMRKARGQAV